MAPQPKSQLEELHQQLLAQYAKASQRVNDELMALADDPKLLRRRARLKEIQNSINEVMTELDDLSLQWAGKQLPKAYLLGAQQGAEQAGGAYKAWTQIAQNAVQNAVQGCVQDLLKATKGVKESTKAFMTSIVKDEEVHALIAGNTAKKAGDLIRKRIEEKGVYAVKYANGSLHGLKEYSEMAVRTRTAVAYNFGSLEGAAGQGVLYWECFDGPDCGLTYHEDPTLAMGRLVTREEAEAWPISHPNCRRSFGPRPDIKTKAEAKKLNSAGNAGSSVTKEQIAAQREQDAQRVSRQQRAAQRKTKAKQKLGLEAPPVSFPDALTFTDGIPDGVGPGWLNGKDYYADVKSVEQLINEGWDPKKAIEEHKRLKNNAASKLSKAKKKLGLTGQKTAATATKAGEKVAAKDTAWINQLLADGNVQGPGENPLILSRMLKAGAPGYAAPGVTELSELVPMDTAAGDFIPLDSIVKVSSANLQVTGWVARRDGILFVLESPIDEPLTPELKAIFEKKISTVLQTESSIPAGSKGLVKEYRFMKQNNPDDAHWAKAYNTPGFKSAATGGKGITTFWGESPVRPGTILHEYGHAVDYKLGIGGKPWTAGDKNWDVLQTLDAKFTTSSFGGNVLPTNAGGHMLQIGSTGITDYGATATVEDFAESFRLYMQDRHDGFIAEAFTTNSEGFPAKVKLTFRDLFPERAKQLDSILGIDVDLNVLTEWEKLQHSDVLEWAQNIISTSGAIPDPAVADMMRLQFGISSDRMKQWMYEAKNLHEKAVAQLKTKVTQTATTSTNTIAKTKKDLPKNVQASIASKKSKYKKSLIDGGMDPKQAEQAALKVEAEEVQKRLEKLFGGQGDVVAQKLEAKGIGQGHRDFIPGLDEKLRKKTGTWLNKAGHESLEPKTPSVDVNFTESQISVWENVTSAEVYKEVTGEDAPIHIKKLMRDKTSELHLITANGQYKGYAIKSVATGKYEMHPLSGLVSKTTGMKFTEKLSGVAKSADELKQKFVVGIKKVVANNEGVDIYDSTPAAQKAKEFLERKIAKKLNNEEDWAKYRQYRINLGYKDPGIFASLEESAREDLLYKECYERVSRWAATSGDSDIQAVAMQMAIKDEFTELGIAGDAMPRVGAQSYGASRKEIATHYTQVGDWYRAFARRQYEYTQEVLEKEGVEYVSVYRGMNFSGSNTPPWLGDARTGNGIASLDSFDLQPGNSWSTSQQTARGFAGGKGPGSVLFEVTVPREYVLGSARTGFGCLNEHEFVLLHKTGAKYRVYSTSKTVDPIVTGLA